MEFSKICIFEEIIDAMNRNLKKGISRTLITKIGFFFSNFCLRGIRILNVDSDAPTIVFKGFSPRMSQMENF